MRATREMLLTGQAGRRGLGQQLARREHGLALQTLRLVAQLTKTLEAGPEVISFHTTACRRRSWRLEA